MLVIESKYRHDNQFVLVCTDEAGGKQYVPVTQEGFDMLEVPEVDPQDG